MARKNTHPENDGNGPSDTARERQELFHAVPETQQERMKQTDYEDAMELQGQAEDLYVESELDTLRDTMERAEQYGAEWNEADVAKMNDQAMNNLADSPPKEFLDQADAQRRRPEELESALDVLIESEPEEAQDVLRAESGRWTAFLEEHAEPASIKDRAAEAVKHAKECEEAFAESEHSPELKRELREKLF